MRQRFFTTASRRTNGTQSPRPRFLTRGAGFLALLFLAVSLSGCAAPVLPTEIVFTVGAGADEVFRVDDLICTRGEMLVYLVNVKNRYELTLGDGVWERETADTSAADVVREICLTQVSQVKAMNLRARAEGIVLDEAERARAHEAAQAYYASLSPEDIRAMGDAEVAQIAAIYEEWTLAEKVYAYIIRDINPEVSDDEARTITVQQICIYKTDGAENARRTMREIQSQLREGETFEHLCAAYNEAATETASFGKEDTEVEFLTEAFALDTGEISEIIETRDAFYLLKCISVFDIEETRRNKERIVERRRQQVFSAQYDTFARSLPVMLNESLWSRLFVDPDIETTTTSLQEVYDLYFE